MAIIRTVTKSILLQTKTQRKFIDKNIASGKKEKEH